MKTKEELQALKDQVEELNKRFAELTEEELEQVTGGIDYQKDYSPEQWKELLLYLFNNS